jgi:hypothetical protein
MLSLDMILLPVLTGIAVFALVGLIWNVFEGIAEENRKDRRP